MSSSSGQDDDDDAIGKGTSATRLARRREAHTAAEQKRRDAIKKGYDSLQDLVPQCHQNEVSGYKPSKAVILQKSIDYIQYLAVAKAKQEKERDALRKEVTALRIMHSNYEAIVNHQCAENPSSQSGGGGGRVTDAVKFTVFQHIMDELFFTFSSLPTGSFTELSSFAFMWLEQNCKPQKLKELVIGVLKKVMSLRDNSAVPIFVSNSGMNESFDDPMVGLGATSANSSQNILFPDSGNASISTIQNSFQPSLIVNRAGNSVVATQQQAVPVGAVFTPANAPNNMNRPFVRIFSSPNITQTPNSNQFSVISAVPSHHYQMDSQPAEFPQYSSVISSPTSVISSPPVLQQQFFQQQPPSVQQEFDLRQMLLQQSLSTPVLSGSTSNPAFRLHQQSSTPSSSAPK